MNRNAVLLLFGPLKQRFCAINREIFIVDNVE